MANITLLGRAATMLGLVLAVGCGGGGDINKGEYCSGVGASVCDREIKCGIEASADRRACQDDFQAGCCGDTGSCSDTTTSAAEQNDVQTGLSECRSMLPTWSCDELATGGLPDGCLGGDNAALTSALTAGPTKKDALLRAGRAVGAAFGK